MLSKGFTLIELIIVIVILGIVSISLSSIVRNAINVVTEVTERENLVREGSFLLARFNRELNKAVPNSVRISGNSNVHCLQFVPLEWSTTYLSIPLVAQSNTTANVIELVDINNNIYVPDSGDFGIVYPSRSDEVYDRRLNHRQAFSACSDDGANTDCASNDDTDSVVQIGFEDGFATESPSKRLYFANQAISYCMRNNEVHRYVGAITPTQTLYTDDGVLMAQSLVNVLGASASTGEQSPFKIVNASLQRNAAVQALFIFGREEERVTFMQEVQIPNVP